MTGYSKEEILGRNCRLLQGEDTDPERVAEIRAAIDAQEPVTTELRNYRRNGTLFWNRVTIAPVHDGSGDVTHFVGFQQDITERKRFERQVERQYEWFEELGEILVHDLRTPLTTIGGRLKLARMTGEEEHLDEALESLDRMERLVEELKVVLREGQLVNDIGDVDVEAVFRRTFRQSDTRDASVVVDSVPDVRADENALARAFENLIQNSVTHGGDDVTVRIGPLPDGFYVEDDGPGIPDAIRDDVLSPGVTTRDEGSGFGLASVHQIVLAHGWSIDIAESTDGGARFEITGVESS